MQAKNEDNEIHTETNDTGFSSTTSVKTHDKDKSSMTINIQEEYEVGEPSKESTNNKTGQSGTDDLSDAAPKPQPQKPKYTFKKSVYIRTKKEGGKLHRLKPTGKFHRNKK